jgi:hypothetical protein
MDIIEQLLGGIRQDETGAPTDAMDRMRQAALAGTAVTGSTENDAIGRGAHRADDPVAVLATVRAARAPARRPRRIPLVAGIAAGLAVAVAGTAFLIDDRAVSPPARQAAQSAPALGSPPAPAPLPQAKDAVTLLRNAATAAGQDSTAPRPDQFIYSERIGRDSLHGNRADAPGRAWVSVDGSKPGVLEDTDKLGRRNRWRTEPNTRPSVYDPTYTFLTTLPTDPAALRAVLRGTVSDAADNGPGKVPDTDQFLFQTIGSLLQTSVLPPRLAAALYQIASQIPGVTLVPDAVDAAGRHGIGVLRRSANRHGGPGEVGSHPVYGAEWIFNPHTYGLIGLRLDSDVVVDSIAITKVAIVDTAPPGAKPLATPAPNGTPAGRPTR